MKKHYTYKFKVHMSCSTCSGTVTRILRQAYPECCLSALASWEKQEVTFVSKVKMNPDEIADKLRERDFAYVKLIEANAKAVYEYYCKIEGLHNKGYSLLLLPSKTQLENIEQLPGEYDTAYAFIEGEFFYIDKRMKNFQKIKAMTPPKIEALKQKLNIVFPEVATPYCLKETLSAKELEVIEKDSEYNIVETRKEAIQRGFLLNAGTIHIDLETNQAKIEAAVEKKTKDLEKCLSEVSPRYTIKWLPVRVSFCFTAAVTEAIAKKIKKTLKEHKAEIDECAINTQGKTIRISVYTAKEDKETIAKLRTRVLSLIQASIAPKTITLTEKISPKIINENAHSPEQYYKKALYNAIFGGLLFLFSGFVPLPLTFAGQMIGFLIGGITLGLMWRTGKEFYVGAWRNLKDFRASNMDTMIALGTGAAWVFSMCVVLAPTFFPLAALQYEFLAAILILGIVNLGKGVREKARMKANRKIQSLEEHYFKQQPQLAKRLKANIKALYDEQALTIEELTEEDFEEISYLRIKKGDIIFVGLDERVPVEGSILKVEGNEGSAFVQDALTGESGPVPKGKGENVLSGSLNIKKAVIIKSTREGAKGKLTQIIEQVSEENKQSEDLKTRISSTIDQIGKFFVPCVIGLAILSAAGWFYFGPVPQAPWMIKSFMSVLLCACPCALGFATPISTTISLTKLLNNKIRVRNVSALNDLAKVGAVILDKTGTLTTLTFKKQDIFVHAKESHSIPEARNLVLQFAASLEKAYLDLKEEKAHPIAKLLVEKNGKTELFNCPEPQKIEKLDQGISGVVQYDTVKAEVVVGTLSHLKLKNVQVDDIYIAQEKMNGENKKTSTYIAVNGKCVGIVGVQHELRPEAKQELDYLKEMEIPVYMFTGDKKVATQKIAEELGLSPDNWKAELTAKDKKDNVAAIQSILDRTGKHAVAFGDGYNDGLMMKKVKGVVSVAVSPFSIAASADPDIVVQRLNIATLIDIAKKTVGNIHQNLWCTFFYNLLSLTVATGILYPFFGIMLNPVIASISMALSSILVVFNSSRLAFIIDDVLEKREAGRSKPASLFERLKEYFTFRTIMQTLEMFLSPNEPEKDLMPKSKEKEKRDGFNHTADFVSSMSNANKPPIRVKRENDLIEVHSSPQKTPPKSVEDLSSPKSGVARRLFAH